MKQANRGRRRFLRNASYAAAGAIGFGSWLAWPEQGVFNPCHTGLPASIARHPLLAAAWQGIDPTKVWDTHTHLVGVGDSGGGAYVSPEMRSPTSPKLFAQYQFYLNAGCVDRAPPDRIDTTYVGRMHDLVAEMPRGFKAMLLAFDAVVTQDGREALERTMLYVPNEYVRRTAAQSPQHFEWVASVHPYRHDAIERLEAAARGGARAVKWLPNAMAIDPAEPRCDGFYAAMTRLGLPLITHAGYEAAVHSPGTQHLGNPLRLRRALDAGVRVVVAHCATLGSDVDLDVGPNGPEVHSFSLFARLMDDRRYEKLLFGDLSAIAQRNRAGVQLAQLLEREAWHARLLNGSDYPLPGILLLFSIAHLVASGMLSADAGELLRDLREHNPLLFDLVLKRNLRSNGRGFPTQVFETRDFFLPGSTAARA